MRRLCAIAFFITLLVPLLFAEDNETCLSCHGQKIDFKKSVHGGNSCISCHVEAAEIPHPAKLSSVQCGVCHEEVRAVYERSVHGQAARAGIRESPVCTDCHGEHIIRAVKDPASSAYVGAITKTCVGCHESEKIAVKFHLPTNRFKTYRDSYHGLAATGGDLHVANCASCHGWHDILPSTDPASSVHIENIPKTCGKCHSGVESRRWSGKIHADTKEDEHFIVFFVRIFYLLLIPIILGVMFLHNAADFLTKMLSSRSTWGEEESEALRMNLNERIQHGVLTLSFCILAYSGFALKFPGAWWGTPLLHLGGEAARKSVHRWTALVFAVLSLYHILYMIFNRRGRFILRYRLMPKVRDFLDAVKMTVFNFGLSKARPRLPYPSYIEKAEYWALFWGSFIMMATGALLVFNDYTLRTFPLWVSKAATMVHFYEAILACLSILVWHFYWSVFDPAVYPVNWSWISGKIKRKEK